MMPLTSQASFLALLVCFASLPACSEGQRSQGFSATDAETLWTWDSLRLRHAPDTISDYSSTIPPASLVRGVLREDGWVAVLAAPGGGAAGYAMLAQLRREPLPTPEEARAEAVRILLGLFGDQELSPRTPVSAKHAGAGLFKVTGDMPQPGQRYTLYLRYDGAGEWTPTDLSTYSVAH